MRIVTPFSLLLNCKIKLQYAVDIIYIKEVLNEENFGLYLLALNSLVKLIYFVMKSNGCILKAHLSWSPT